MKLSETAQAFLSLCCKGENGIGINPWFKNEYKIGEKMYKFDVKVWEEIKSSGLVVVMYESDKEASFRGKRKV